MPPAPGSLVRCATNNLYVWREPDFSRLAYTGVIESDAVCLVISQKLVPVGRVAYHMLCVVSGETIGWIEAIGLKVIE